MNFSENFQEFSGRLGPTDLVLYAGAGIILWVLFKDQLSPVQKMIVDFINKFKNKTTTNETITEPVVVQTENIFLELIVSWKQTRDLAEKTGCVKAIEVLDQMFPYLSPKSCKEVSINE